MLSGNDQHIGRYTNYVISEPRTNNEICPDLAAQAWQSVTREEDSHKSYVVSLFYRRAMTGRILMTSRHGGPSTANSLLV